MANTITGRILSISPTTYITTRKGDNLPKRTLVIDLTRYDPRTGQRSPYDNTPEVEFASDLCAQLDQFKPGDNVTITFEVQGTKYTSREGIEKIFTRLRPYRIERYGNTAAPAAAQHYQQPAATQPATQAAPTYVPGITQGNTTPPPAAVYGQPTPAVQAAPTYVPGITQGNTTPPPAAVYGQPTPAVQAAPQPEPDLPF